MVVACRRPTVEPDTPGTLVLSAFEGEQTGLVDAMKDVKGIRKGGSKLHVTVSGVFRLTTVLGVLLAFSGFAAGLGCGKPVGPWELVIGDVQTATFDQDDFQQRGTAAFVFTLPTEFADDTPGAFYRIEGSFVRGAPAPAAERILIRATPRFSTLEGSVEATTFIPPQTSEADLLIQGDLNRCEDAAECTRELTIDVGWLSPPSDPNGTLALTLATSIEMRGGGTESDPGPPTAASATVAVVFE